MLAGSIAERLIAGSLPALRRRVGMDQSSYCPTPATTRQKRMPMNHVQVWAERLAIQQQSMVNQYVLRGGSCAIPKVRIRASFRNFFPASTCWQFSGIRLARDVTCQPRRGV